MSRLFGALRQVCRYEWMGIVAVAVVALLFSTYKLTESPAIWYDEGFYVQLAQSQADFGELKLQVAPGEFAPPTFVTVGFPLLYPVSWAISLAGPGVLQSRAVMPLFIVAATLMSYLLARALWGWRAAVLGGLLLASFPLLYGNGKTVLGEVPGFLYLITFLYALVCIEKSQYRSRLAYLVGGIALGLCVATKPIFLLALPAFACALLIKRKSIVWHWRYIALACSTAALPVLWWVYTQSLLGDNLWLRYSNPYEVTNIVGTVWGNALRFITEATPLYFAAAIMVWLAAVAVRLYRHERISVVEWTALLFTLLVAAAYLRTAGWYRYFFIGHMMALVAAPAALLMLAEALGRYAPLVGRAARLGAVAAVVLVSSYQITQLVSGSFVAEQYTRTTTAQLAQYFETRAGQVVFLYDVPELAVFVPDRNYYQYLAPVGGLRYGAEQLEVLTQHKVDFAVLRSAAEDAPLTGYTTVHTIGGYRIVEPTR